MVKLVSPAQVTVATGGTPSQLASTEVRAKALLLIPDADNAGDVWLGDSNVSAANERGALIPSSGLNVDADGDGFDLQDFYVDVTVNGDKVSITYFEIIGRS